MNVLLIFLFSFIALYYFLPNLYSVAFAFIIATAFYSLYSDKSTSFKNPNLIING